MKLIGLISRTLIFGLAVLSAACTTTPTIQTGPNAEVSFDGLHKVDNSQADMAWAKPGFDISGYTKLMLVGEGIEYAPAENRGRTSYERSRPGPYFIDEDTRERFEALVRDTFLDEISKIEHFEIVNEPGPDVLMVRGALLDVESYVPQDPMDQMGRGGIYLSRVGQATLVLELRDSETGAILARSIDRRAAESAGGMMFESNRVTNANEVRRLVRFWARRLREGLDGWVERQQQTGS